MRATNQPVVTSWSSKLVGIISTTISCAGTPAGRTTAPHPPSTVLSRCFRATSGFAGPNDPNDVAALLDDLINHERSGIPAAAGTAASSRFDLGRMHRLLAAMGNPHLGLKAIHVAGSKGKGSTVSLLATSLTAAGYRTGAYTSPHLLALEERIAVGHPGGATPRPRPVAPDDLAFLTARHADAIRRRVAAEDGQLSHFEVVTALAFRYFADCSVDVAVVETGLGGVTDATNVLPGDSLLAAVITGLGLEHVEALGGSLASIAAAKVGITRAGRPLVLAPQRHPEAEEVVLREAAARGCPVTRPQQSVLVHSLGMELSPDRHGQAVRERLRLELLPEPHEASAGGQAAGSRGPPGGAGRCPHGGQRSGPGGGRQEAPRRQPAAHKHTNRVHHRPPAATPGAAGRRPSAAPRGPGAGDGGGQGAPGSGGGPAGTGAPGGGIHVGAHRGQLPEGGGAGHPGGPLAGGRHHRPRLPALLPLSGAGASQPCGRL